KKDLHLRHIREEVLFLLELGLRVLRVRFAAVLADAHAEEDALVRDVAHDEVRFVAGARKARDERIGLGALLERADLERELALLLLAFLGLLRLLGLFVLRGLFRSGRRRSRRGGRRRDGRRLGRRGRSRRRRRRGRLLRVRGERGGERKVIALPLRLLVGAELVERGERVDLRRRRRAVRDALAALQALADHHSED